MFSPTREALEAQINAHAAEFAKRGLKFVVLVENQRGEWFHLEADDQGHAGALMQNWVEVMGAREASARRLDERGLHPRPFATRFWQPDYEEDER